MLALSIGLQSRTEGSSFDLKAESQSRGPTGKTGLAAVYEVRLKAR